MEAYEILFENRDILDQLVLELLEKETLNKEEIATIFSAMNKRPARPAWTGSDRRRTGAGPVDAPIRNGQTAPNGQTMLPAEALRRRTNPAAAPIRVANLAGARRPEVWNRGFFSGSKRSSLDTWR